MKKILIDSGPLIALFDASDKYHHDAVNFIKKNKYPLVTTQWVGRGAVEIYNIEKNDFKRLKELTEKYRDLPMDFADSCLVYIAEKLDLNTIATIDRDFTIYRIKGRRKFKIILS